MSYHIILKINDCKHSKKRTALLAYQTTKCGIFCLNLPITQGYLFNKAFIRLINAAGFSNVPRSANIA